MLISLVCRLLEQEKAAHSELKNTWEMANLQFLENLRVQKEAYTKVWNILTTEQRIIAQEQQQDESQVGKLIDLQSPQTSPQPTVQQVRCSKLGQDTNFGIFIKMFKAFWDVKKLS